MYTGNTINEISALAADLSKASFLRRMAASDMT